MTVLWHVTMSLDGYIAGPGNSMGWLSMSWLAHVDRGLPPVAHHRRHPRRPQLVRRGAEPRWPTGDLRRRLAGAGSRADPPARTGITRLWNHLRHRWHRDRGRRRPRRSAWPERGRVRRTDRPPGDRRRPPRRDRGARRADPARGRHPAPRRPGVGPTHLEPIWIGRTGALADLHYRVLSQPAVAGPDAGRRHRSRGEAVTGGVRWRHRARRPWWRWSWRRNA